MFTAYMNSTFRDLSSNPLVCGYKLISAFSGINGTNLYIIGTCLNKTKGTEEQLSSYANRPQCGKCGFSCTFTPKINYQKVA